MLCLNYPFRKTKEKRTYNETEKKKRKRKIFLPLFLIFFIIIGFYSHQSYETAMHEQLPDSLIEFEQKYPEATDFVENYHKYKNKSFDLDVSHEVRKDNIPLFIQWDKRWGQFPWCQWLWSNFTFYGYLRINWKSNVESL